MRIWQPADSWLPAIAPAPSDNNSFEFGRTANSNAKLLGSEEEDFDEIRQPNKLRNAKRPPSESLFNIKESEETAIN